MPAATKLSELRAAGRSFQTAHRVLYELCAREQRGGRVRRRTLEKAAREVIVAAVELGDAERRLARWRREGREHGYFLDLTERSA